MKDNIKILKFLYEKKLEWANFCFIWGNNLWVSNWSNIPWYDSYFDVFKWTWINDYKLINELVVNWYLVNWRSRLLVWMTNKWMSLYKDEIKPFYQKINYITIWKIILGVITTLWTIFWVYYSILTFYFK